MVVLSACVVWCASFEPYESAHANRVERAQTYVLQVSCVMYAWYMVSRHGSEDVILKTRTTQTLAWGILVLNGIFLMLVVAFSLRRRRRAKSYTSQVICSRCFLLCLAHELSFI